MKTKDLRKLEKQELQEKLDEIEKTLLKKNAQRRTGTVENPGEIKSLRRTIAKINTLLRDKQ